MNREIRDLGFVPEAIAPLLGEGAAGDGTFLLRLQEEWRTGRCRFEGPNECLLGLFEDGRLSGIGGVSEDPYEPSEGLGRVRHVYVLKSCRRRGIGRTLVGRLVERSRGRFAVLRLRTRSPVAAQLYESLGFVRTDAPDETHRLLL